MFTSKTNLRDTFELNKLSSKELLNTVKKWDISPIKKLITTKWPVEMYQQNNIFKDFWLVLTSQFTKSAY